MNRAYSAPCKWGPNGPIGTIRFYFAQDDAEFMTGPQTFWPYRNFHQLVNPDQPGEITSGHGPRVFHAGTNFNALPGDHHEGEPEDFAGQWLFDPSDPPDLAMCDHPAGALSDPGVAVARAELHMTALGIAGDFARADIDASLTGELHASAYGALPIEASLDASFVGDLLTYTAAVHGSYVIGEIPPTTGFVGDLLTYTAAVHGSYVIGEIPPATGFVGDLVTITDAVHGSYVIGEIPPTTGFVGDLVMIGYGVHGVALFGVLDAPLFGDLVMIATESHSALVDVPVEDYSTTDSSQSPSGSIDVPVEDYSSTDADTSNDSNIDVPVEDHSTTDSIAAPVPQHSLSFDGEDDYVDAGNDASLQITGEITLAGWFKGSSPTGAGLGVSKNGSTGNFGYSLAMSSAGVVLANVAATSSSLFFTFTTGHNPAVWTHYAMVFSPSNYIRLYANGVLVAEKTTGAPASHYSASNNLLIGTTSVPSPPHYDGLIDDVRLYERALDGAELATLAAGGEPDDTGLVLHLPLDEGTGSTANDVSGNDNHGTIHGATWSGDVP